MSITIPEIAAIGGLVYLWDYLDRVATKGERTEEVALALSTLEKRIGSQAPTQVVAQKEVELIKRGVGLPPKPDADPALYDAELDQKLITSAGEAGDLQPMTPDRLVEYGNPQTQTAGKVIMDYLYWLHPREPPKEPPAYYPDP
jgi:hypothetical protein